MIMDTKKKQEIIMKLKELLDDLSFEFWKDDKKDYKYSSEWDEILKGNDYY